MTHGQPRAGDIIELLLPNNLGFAYAKFIDLRAVNARYPGMLRVYNCWTREQAQDFSELDTLDLLMHPLLVAGYVGAYKEGYWRPLITCEVYEDELIIPAYKKAEPNAHHPTRWYYVEQGDVRKKLPASKEQVQHLEFLGAVGSEVVSTKIAINLIIAAGLDPGAYFELDEYFEKHFVEEAMSKPPYYKLPKQIRGRPAPF